jgi:protease-4
MLDRSKTLRLLLLASLAVGPAAFAQTISVGGRSPTDGLLLPPSSAATVEDAASGSINPAGVGLVRGLQLEYFHDREQEGPSIVGDGAYLAATFFDVVSAGVSLEWIRPTNGYSWWNYRKTHWTLAWSPDPSFSLGLALNVFSSNSPTGLCCLNGVTSWDAGLILRPWSWLSLGASVRDFDTPTFAGVTQPRKYDFAIGIRPYKDWATFAVDYLFFGENEIDSLAQGPTNGRLALTAQLKLFRGLGLLLGGSLPLNQNTGYAFVPSSPTVELGVALDTEHLGLVGAVASPGNNVSASGGDLILGARMSLEAFPSLPNPLARVAVVDVDDILEGSKSGILGVLFPSHVDPYEKLVQELNELGSDPGLAGVALRLGSLGLGLGRIEGLRDVIHRLRAHGKKVAVLMSGGGDLDYYLAAAADRVYGLTQADYLFKGLSASSFFAGEGLQKLGVHIDVVRVGPYKDAPDILTRDSPSEAQEEVTKSLLDSAMQHYVQGVSTDRNIRPADFLKTLDRGLTSAEQGRSEGLFDGVMYPDEIGKQLRELFGRPVFLEANYLGRPAHEPRWGSTAKIALVNVFGLINGGQSSSGLVRTSGSATVSDALHEAAEDSSVRAIVVRVDSGGGDVEASELIWRAIKQAKRHKPVVVSFGDVAASGGYYIAVAGDEILAEPSTITGSIGVFALKPDFSELLGKIGVHTFIDKNTANADLFNLTRRWSDRQFALMQKEIDSSYDTFLDRVGEGRGLSKAAVDGIARGRVWDGAQALERHLVDGLGSLTDAVEHAKARAHVDAAEPIDLVVFGGSKAFMDLGGTEAQAQSLNRLLAWVPGLAPMLVLDPARPLAMPEVEVRIH